MISTNRHEQEREPASRFAILTIGDDDAALSRPTLGNAVVRRFNSRPGHTETADLHLLALNDGYDAVFVAGFGARAHDALQLAARLPDLVHGVLLFTPHIQQTHLSRLAANVAKAINATVQRLANSFAPLTGLALQIANISAAATPQSLSDIMQPVMIFHPRAGCNADIKVAATLQRHLGGPVEVQFVGPGADVDIMSPLNPALSRRCSDFTTRVGAGAEGRRAKRQRAADNSAASSTSRKPARSAPIPASLTRFAGNVALTAPNASA